MRRMLCLSMAAALTAATTLGAQVSANPTSSDGAKSPTTARVIGIVPGAGHIYAGETGRGLAYLGGVVGIVVIGGVVTAADCVVDALGTANDTCPSEDGIGNVVTVAALGLWGWSIYDAGRAARRTNASRGIRSSLILTPTIAPPSSHSDRMALRLGLSLQTR